MAQIDITALSLTSKSSNQNGRISWPQVSSTKQYFSLPSSIIYYISKNPSKPKIYSKLIQCCKYFFEKLPLFIVSRIHDHGRKLCSNDIKDCVEKNQKCCIKIDITKLFAKLWLVGKPMECDIRNIASIFKAKLYRPEHALLTFKEAMKFANFKLWASIYQNFDLFFIKMIKNDGSIAMFEDVLESIPDVRRFVYIFDRNTPTANASTMKKVMELKNLGNLKFMGLFHIPEIFCVPNLKEFIIKQKDTKLFLLFSSNVSAEYKKQLDKLIDTVIACGVFKCLIQYDGQDRGKLKVMENLLLH